MRTPTPRRDPGSRIVLTGAPAMRPWHRCALALAALLALDMDLNVKYAK